MRSYLLKLLQMFEAFKWCCVTFILFEVTKISVEGSCRVVGSAKIAQILNGINVNNDRNNRFETLPELRSETTSHTRLTFPSCLSF